MSISPDSNSFDQTIYSSYAPTYASLDHPTVTPCTQTNYSAIDIYQLQKYHQQLSAPEFIPSEMANLVPIALSASPAPTFNLQSQMTHLSPTSTSDFIPQSQTSSPEQVYPSPTGNSYSTSYHTSYYGNPYPSPQPITGFSGDHENLNFQQLYNKVYSNPKVEVKIQHADSSSDSRRPKAKAARVAPYQPKKRSKGTEPAAKKRTEFTSVDVKILEDNFAISDFARGAKKDMLAEQLGVTPRAITIWYQNKRARVRNQKAQMVKLMEAAKTGVVA